MLPLEIVEEFRRVSIERLKRIEAAWTALLETPGDREQANLMYREAHNLKGESRLVGFADVNLLCHKLEDLFEVARGCEFQVNEDFDVAVTMTTRFMAMLVRKKAGTHLGGIDLPGFIQHLESVIAEMRQAPAQRAASTIPARGPSHARLPKVLREGLGLAALDVFLEATARGGSGRLVGTWQGLRQHLAVDDLQDLRPQLEKHQPAIATLVKELGKEATVAFEIAPLALPAEVVSALDTAVLHLARNAIDHGLETPAQRVAAGRPSAGRVAVHVTAANEVVVLRVSDDGRGIDFDLVRRRAIAIGWLDASAQAAPSREELTGLMMQPGFSTKTEITDVSGRGVGLDAVAAALTSVGGTLRVETSPAGTAWIGEIPVPSPQVQAHTFRVPQLSVPIAIPTDWQLSPEPPPTVVDLVAALGLGPGPRGTVKFGVQRAGKAIGFAAESAPAISRVRRLVTTPARAIAEIALIDGVEGLLLRPEYM